MQITKIRSESGDNTTDLTDTKSIIRKYYEQLHMNKFENKVKMQIPRNTQINYTYSRRNRKSQHTHNK